MKVALVHDWLTNVGGGANVMWQLHQIWPEAPIYTSVFDQAALPQFKDCQVITSGLQYWPLAKSKHQLYPLMRQRAFESFDFQDFDVVISASSAEAKGIVTRPSTLHVDYVFTPTRYYWSDWHSYHSSPGFGPLDPLIRLVMPIVISKTRQWDFAAAQRSDRLVAISHFVAARVLKYYRREADVIHPPVQLSRFKLGTGPRQGFLLVSRLIPYKRAELAVQACNELGLELKVVGRGSQLERLRNLAGPTITFLPDATDEEVARLYGQAEALIFTPEEDFGIVPLEAQASGTPVIALAAGGALETVVANKTGLFYNRPTVASLKQALKDFRAEEFSAETIRHQAERFNDEAFRSNFQSYIERQYRDYKAD